MGFNTTVVILNDDLHIVENDPEFGKKLANAIRSMRSSASEKPIDVSARSGNCTACNAASVIETHHADNTILVRVGGNTGSVVGLEAASSQDYDPTHADIRKELSRFEPLHDFLIDKVWQMVRLAHTRGWAEAKGIQVPIDLYH